MTLMTVYVNCGGDLMVAADSKLTKEELQHLAAAILTYVVSEGGDAAEVLKEASECRAADRRTQPKPLIVRGNYG